MAEHFKSIGYFLLGILKRAYYWIPPIFLDPFDLYQKFLSESTQAKYKAYIDMPQGNALFIFILLIVWAAILTYHEQRKQNLGPKLKIIHKKGETDFYHKAYTHIFINQEIDPLSIDSLSNGKLKDLSYDLHRISIENLSPKEYAKDVEIEITNMEPENAYIRNEFPIKLRFKDDKTKPFKQYQNINPGKPIFVDVIRMKLDDNRNPRFFEILTSEEKKTRFSFNCKNEKYKITITASSKNTPLVMRKFEFGCTYTDEIKLWFKPLTFYTQYCRRK